MKLQTALLVIVSILALLVSCSRRSPIVGKWQEIAGDNETIEFLKSGTFSLVSKGRAIGGKYNNLDDSRIKLELGGTGTALRPIVMHVVLSGNELSITDPFGKVSRYIRAK